MWNNLVEKIKNSNSIDWESLDSCQNLLVSSEEKDYFDFCKLVLMKVRDSDLRDDNNFLRLKKVIIKQYYPILVCLCSLLSLEKDECLRRDKLIELIIQFIYSQNHLENIFKKICSIVIYSQDTSLDYDSFINCLVNIPTIVANITQKKTSHMLLPLFYFPRLCEAIFSSLEFTNERLKDSKDSNLEFITKLIGRICSSGYSDIYNEKILKPIISKSSDLVWRRIGNRIITGQNDRCLEHVLHPLFYAPKSSIVECILKDGIQRPKIQFLLCNKFILVHIDSHLFLSNLIEYVYAKSKDLFFKMMENLLDIWSNSSSLRHRSFNQHFYICSALVLCVRCLKDSNNDYKKLTKPIIYGMETYLKCASYEFRCTGLYTGQMLTSLINSPKLDFEIDKINEVKQLDDLYNYKISNENNEFGNKDKNFESEIKDVQIVNKNNDQDQNLDKNDDDLVAFDMSHDAPIEKTKKPFYIRDCINGLREADKPDWVQTCLECAEDLIKKNANMIEDNAVEFTKTLLFLEDEFDTPNFTHLRRNAMVQLCFFAPVSVSNFLTSQFYERNHVIRRRLDILEILAITSEKLSDPNETNQFINGIPHEVIIAEKKWRTIMETMDTRTRMISRPRYIRSYINKFAPVAGNFFFPLIRTFKGLDVTFNLMGDDYFLLGRLLYSLGIMLHSASQAPIAIRMGAALIQFLWTFRYHSESFVRQAIIFCFCTILSSVPSVSLFERFQNDLLELKEWLILITEKDTNEECVTRAHQTLALLRNLIQRNIK